MNTCWTEKSQNKLAGCNNKDNKKNPTARFVEDNRSEYSGELTQKQSCKSRRRDEAKLQETQIVGANNVVVQESPNSR